RRGAGLRLLGALLLLGDSAACVGSFEAPAGSLTCRDCSALDGGLPGQGQGNPGDDENPDPTRPDGVGDPASPNGVGWATRFPKVARREWVRVVGGLLRFAWATGDSADFVGVARVMDCGSDAAAEQTVGGDAWSRDQAAAEYVAQYIVSVSARMRGFL